jgi:hypothetical protein
MRTCQAVLLALAAAGCRADRAEPAPHFAAAGPFAGAAGADVVQLDVALVERPPGDDFLNRGLWQLADEQAAGLDALPRLQDNGWRVGLLGGLPPEGLQTLLTSPRSCPDPRRLQVHAGRPVPVPLGGTRPRLRFRLDPTSNPVDVDLAEARCVLEVVPSLTDDGRVRLHFVPQVEHGRPGVAFAALREPGGPLRWERQEEQPRESYPRQGWEVVAAPHEYVAVGTSWERGAGTLGQACLLALGEGRPVQRLLVLRTTRSLAEPAPAAGPDMGRSPPLALRAGLATARGKGD